MTRTAAKRMPESVVRHSPAADDDLDAIVDEVRQLHNELEESARTNIEKAIRIGELLTEVKNGLPHGRWLALVGCQRPV